MKKHDVAKVATEFWHQAGYTETFPRSLEQAIAWVLPIAVVKLPRLRTMDVSAWLQQRGISFPHRSMDRSLRACLVARKGMGIIFIDGCDSDDERRFSLAHEAAHFICDYLEPRRLVFDTLGEAGLEILDGLRDATIEERLGGLLRGAHLGTFARLMERDSNGDAGQTAILEAEDRADLLALELLAPHKVVLKRLSTQSDSLAVDSIQRLLACEFGLPRTAAQSYARILSANRRKPRNFAAWLGY